LSEVSNISPQISIKGIREGLLVTLEEGEWPELEQALLDHIERQGDFLKGAQLTLDIGNQQLKAAELGHLRDILSDRGVTLRAVLSHSPSTEIAAQDLGLATRLSKPRPERATRPLDTKLTGDEAMLVRRTLRSGHNISYFGHVIVVGDVNPGAEIVAGGNIVVWGHLRGTVHAGADGNKNARIYALDMSPTQLRIADQISLVSPKKKKTGPEVARLLDNRVIAEPWDNK
jgi:septum site-determining protein MinC